MMGQAKKRGSFEDRKKAAIEKRAQETVQISATERQKGKSRIGALALWSAMLAVTDGVDITYRATKDKS